jgi:tRNA threonylcarbamoyladenosine biosynthesis protein TsaB
MAGVADPEGNGALGGAVAIESVYYLLMLVLALDTTTRMGSCAVARDGGVVRQDASDPSVPQASKLPAQLMTTLQESGIELAQIDLFAVATGPGSFTGLRVGIATMQGLAFAAGKPLIGISALDALASIAGPTRVATWIDAWRGEVFAGLYDGGIQIEAPTLALPGVLLARLALTPTLFIGDGAAAHREAIHAALGDEAALAMPVVPLIAGTIARLATVAARSGHRPGPGEIRPLYVHRPTAERTADARAVR